MPEFSGLTHFPQLLLLWHSHTPSFLPPGSWMFLLHFGAVRSFCCFSSSSISSMNDLLSGFLPFSCCNLWSADHFCCPSVTINSDLSGSKGLHGLSPSYLDLLVPGFHEPLWSAAQFRSVRELKTLNSSLKAFRLFFRVKVQNYHQCLYGERSWCSESGSAAA